MANIDTSDLVKLGIHYISLKVAEVTNPFWKDVLSSWLSYFKKVEISSIDEILYSPLWYNNFFVDTSLFLKSWYEKHVFYVIDLLNNEGEFYDFTEFKRLFNV